MIKSNEIIDLVQLASTWVEKQENFILSKGIKLNPKQMDLASKIGIIEIEKVRLLKVVVLHRFVDFKVNYLV